LEAMWPEIYDQCMSESSVKVLKIDLDDDDAR
jgi:hypothetical protein